MDCETCHYCIHEKGDPSVGINPYLDCLFDEVSEVDEEFAMLEISDAIIDGYTPHCRYYVCFNTICPICDELFTSDKAIKVTGFAENTLVCSKECKEKYDVKTEKIIKEMYGG